MKNLPPLNPLRAFEAAARHSSIRNAAQEMNVTPGAISRQVKVLENFLGIKLFRRLPGETKLTAEGQQYFERISPHIWALADATKMMIGCKGIEIVHIRAYTTLACMWLIPRLSDFAKQYPNIEIRLTTSLEAVDFESEQVDAAIRLGDGNHPGLVIDKLMVNHLVPLCTPEYAEKESLKSKEDLVGKHLLHSLARPEDWRIWIEEAGLQKEIDWYQGTKFTSSMLSYQATLNHQGIMMAQKALFDDDLICGRLIQPFGPTVKRENFTYHLLYPSSRLRSNSFRNFQAWLKEKCAYEMRSVKN